MERTKKCVFRIAKKIPYITKQIEAQLDSVSKGFVNDIEERTKLLRYITNLPANGLRTDDIIKALDKNLKLGDYEWKKGLVSGSVYYFNDDLIDLVSKVYHDTSYTNPLHPDLFPGLCKMEAEILRIASNLFNGNEDTCGSVKFYLTFPLYILTFSVLGYKWWH